MTEKPIDLSIYEQIDLGDFIACFDKEFYPSDEMGPSSVVASLYGVRFSDGTEVIDPKEWNEKHSDFISWNEIEDSINEKLNN